MIDIKALESDQVNPETNNTYLVDYKASLESRGEDSFLVDEVLAINKRRKTLTYEAEEAKARQNKVSGEIAKKKKNKEDASDLLKDMQTLAGEVKGMYKKLEDVEVELKDRLSHIPNKNHHTVPVGKSEEDNQEVSRFGEPPAFSFKAKDHIELGESKDILDFERAGKVTGARFTYLKAMAARMERSLMQFMMDTHSDEHGYTEIIPPFIVNSQSMYGTSQFPKFKDDVFHLSNTDYYLIPTSEVSVTNIFAKEILSTDQLPTSYVAYSPCFRSEAGSYGKDTKGLIRQHQFNKVELLKFTRPEDSYQALEELTSHAETILQKLGLHYRKMSLCSGDISFGAAKCYDLEVWLPGQEAFREISSCSNFEDFQARRANIRFRDGKEKPRFVHTLNGSGLAIGRTLIAILENYQQEDGTIKVPEVLQKYMGCDKF